MKFYYSLFFILLFSSVNGQTNLVPNYSFENITTCQGMLGGFESGYCPPWFTPPNGGSPDLFNPCSNPSQTGVPDNKFGYQYAQEGMGFVGAGVFPSGEREYIEASLNTTLIQGRKYCVQFYVNVCDSSFYAIDCIGAYFSSDTVYQNFTNPILVSAQVQNPTGNIISDTLNWTLISGYFIAIGGERFITIGNFKSDSNTNYDTLNNPFLLYAPAAYYYIDNVSVYECDTLYNSFVPSAFSPNGDGNNDALFVRGQNIKDLHFSIYDRLGEKVFETTDITKGWDGTFKNEKCNNSVFVYYLDVTYTDGKAETKKGEISLIR